MYLEACEELGIVPVSYFLKNYNVEHLVMRHHGLGTRGGVALSRCFEVRAVGDSVSWFPRPRRQLSLLLVASHRPAFTLMNALISCHLSPYAPIALHSLVYAYTRASDRPAIIITRALVSNHGRHSRPRRPHINTTPYSS